jgi:hypothetical protein
MVNYCYFYVYYSYEEWGRGYIGSRECKCSPERDTKYFGSFSDKTFKPTQKIILQTFKTKEEAINAEVILHSFYQVDINPHFANKAKQTSKKFYYSKSGKDNSMYGVRLIGELNPMFGKPSPMLGKTLSEETRKKMSLAAKGERNGFYGKKHSRETRKKFSEKRKNQVVSEETKQKLSKKLRGRIFSEETKQKISLSKRGKNLGKDNSFFGKTHSEETKKRLSEIRKGENGPAYGKRWFTNNEKEVLSFECPPGFRPGRLRFQRK